MSNWLFKRVTDILLAVVIMVGLLWFALTQPVFSFSLRDAQEVELDPQALLQYEQELVNISTSTDNVGDIFDATSDFLMEKLTNIGNAEQLDRGNGQRVIKLTLGDAADERLIITLHYAVLDRPIPEIIATAVALIETARAVGEQENATMQLELSIFLHRLDNLAASLMNASTYQLEQMAQYNPAKTTVFLLMPGMKTPNVAYTGGQWRYLHLLMPSRQRTDIALFGRLNDTLRLRTLKHSLQESGVGNVSSLSIPVHLPGVQPSPLKQYWDRDVPAFLMQPNMLVNEKGDINQSNFVTALAKLVKQGY